MQTYYYIEHSFLQGYFIIAQILKEALGSMADPSRFQDSGYVNWLKAGQALICTAEGIYAFCDDVIRNYHLALHQKFPRQPCDGICQYVTP